MGHYRSYDWNVSWELKLNTGFQDLQRKWGKPASTDSPRDPREKLSNLKGNVPKHTDIQVQSVKTVPRPCFQSLYRPMLRAQPKIPYEVTTKLLLCYSVLLSNICYICKHRLNELELDLVYKCILLHYLIELG